RNIVSVFDLGALDDGSPFIVMELMEGESLERIMQRRGRLAPDELLGVLLPVLAALSVAHTNQIVHRDLKPENIFLSVDPDGSTTPKIVDFGVSKMTTIDRQTRMTRTGMVVGTPIYMPPEQARGRDVDGRADLWAVGVIMYEALSGQLPFDGDNYNTLVASILTQEAKPLSSVAPEVDAELSALVMRALRRDLDERYASADVFAAELGGWLVRRGMPVPPRCPEVSVVHSTEPIVAAGAAERPRRPELAPARPTAKPTSSVALPRSSSPVRGMLLGAAVTAAAIGGGAIAFFVARGDDPAPSAEAPPSAVTRRSPPPSPEASAVIAPTPAPPPPASARTALPTAPLVTSSVTHVATTSPPAVSPRVVPVVPAPAPAVAPRVAAANVPSSPTASPPPAPAPAPAPATRVAPVATNPPVRVPSGVAQPAPPPTPASPDVAATTAARDRARRGRDGRGPGRTAPLVAPLAPSRPGPQLPPSPGF
ncbi:MAG: serine/threonine protein kinase, partial [Deltaproteobacteria bacterium]|nr:serine/threonine protein kinase [Deltaproteobacteria bacterium]